MNPEQIMIKVNDRMRSLKWLVDNADAATTVRVENCPGLTSLPALNAARVVRCLLYTSPSPRD